MKKLKLTKTIASSLIAVSVLAINPIGANAQFVPVPNKDGSNMQEWRRADDTSTYGWQQIDGKWYFYYENQKQTGWMYIGKWYYLDANGVMQTGWINTNGKWYYLNASGAMAHDVFIGDYYVDSSGVWNENIHPYIDKRLEGAITSGNFKFNKSTGTIVKYTGTDTTLIIPNTIDGVTVKSIGEGAFFNCSSLTSITIPDSVTLLINSAFEGCSGLKNVTIPGNVERIGNSAFAKCTSLTSVTIKDGVRSIEDEAFKGCSSLTSITIPDSVGLSIGLSSFSGCSSLTNINANERIVTLLKATKDLKEPKNGEYIRYDSKSGKVSIINSTSK